MTCQNYHFQAVSFTSKRTSFNIMNLIHIQYQKLLAGGGLKKDHQPPDCRHFQATGAVSAQSGSVRVCHMVDCSSSLDPFCCVWEIRVSVTEHFWHSFAQLVEYLHLANQAMAVTARLGIQVSNVDILWQNVHLKLHWANQAFAGLQQ